MNTVEINRRFARSARLDADLNGTPPLVGYVLQASVEKSLTTLASAQIDSRQGAFTWTGPYGGGKSSAALLLANLVAGKAENRAIAQDIAGPALSDLYARAFPQDNGSWLTVAVTGSRAALRSAVAEAAAQSLRWTKATFEKATHSDAALIDLLMTSAEKRGGVLLILDELGKILEHEALDGGDIHLLQDLAEHSTRSGGRLVVIGILHQAFDQYAARAARASRDEWAKVQGRYQDISFLAGADETVALLGRAITAKQRPKSSVAASQFVAAAIAKRRPTDVEVLSQALSQTWPLNPVTSLLLGPVSRQRFAQNERSVFGFLSSAEPAGFQEFIASASQERTYDPSLLWDYLVSNFGMSLASGVDGARFSLAFEAVERASAKGSPLHVALTKSAAVIEFFRNGSGLALADDILAAATPNVSDAERTAAIADLLSWAILIRQPRLNGYALFAGSDFDLEEAISKATTPLDSSQMEAISQQIGMGFANAKRHYFRTGTLRTFEVIVTLTGHADSTQSIAGALSRRKGKAAGTLALILNDGTLDAVELENRCRAVAKQLQKDQAIVAVGGVKDGFSLRLNASELYAVDRVFRDHPQLEGDRIARREIAARRSGIVNDLHKDLEHALNTTKWWLAPNPAVSFKEPVSVIASELADAAFKDAVTVHSELLQRDKPSSSAMAASRELCHAMVARHDQKDLGFEGYPAAMGLYITVLQSLGLHGKTDGGFGFTEPGGTEQSSSLAPAWKILREADSINLEDVYQRWAKAPIGLKAGIMPVIALAGILSDREHIAVYIDGVFQTELDDVFVDKFLQRPADVRLRRIDRSLKQIEFLNGLAQRLDVSDATGSLPVAQALFRRFEALPLYSQRTDTLGSQTLRVRGAVLKSRDPEDLLFVALPNALDDDPKADIVYDALVEAEEAYPALLAKLRQSLARSLAVDQITFDGLSQRAEAIRNLTNDFAFEAFIMRAAAFEHGTGDIEGIASLLLHKPARSWSDRDREQGLLQLARYGRQFRELEALAVVRDRRSSTEALALVVGVDPTTPPLLRSFILTEGEKVKATVLAEDLLKTLGSNNDLARIQLAALARAMASLAADTEAVNHEV
ncbi:ATP-binding protein [Sinorhizobium medicae]|nr:ATP-binding protein [Sinorhizobium medicae]